MVESTFKTFPHTRFFDALHDGDVKNDEIYAKRRIVRGFTGKSTILQNIDLLLPS